MGRRANRSRSTLTISRTRSWARSSLTGSTTSAPTSAMSASEIDHDTGEFAVNAVRCWLDQMGWKLYPGMRRLMITADGGGSNGSRLRLWKLALQQLADETGLIIQVCPYPPGTSKWNKIEHRMFCHITQNWRATPLLSLLIVIELIANTTTKAGLKIRCELDSNTYPKGIKVSDAEMATLNMTRELHSIQNGTTASRRGFTKLTIVFGHRLNSSSAKLRWSSLCSYANLDRFTSTFIGGPKRSAAYRPGDHRSIFFEGPSQNPDCTIKCITLHCTM